MLPGHSLPGSSMATWALGRSNGVDSRHAYTTTLSKSSWVTLTAVVGQSDLSQEDLLARWLCHQMFSAVISFGEASAAECPCSAPCPSAGCFTLVLRNVTKTYPESALGLAKVVLGPPCAKSGCHSQDSDTCSQYPVLRAMSQGNRFAALIQYWMDPLRDGWNCRCCDGSLPSKDGK